MAKKPTLILIGLVLLISFSWAAANPWSNLKKIYFYDSSGDISAVKENLAQLNAQGLVPAEKIELLQKLNELGVFTEYKIYKKLFNLFNKGLMKKKEKTEIQEIQEKKFSADLHLSNDSKLKHLFNFFLIVLALSLLLTFFTPLRPIHKKSILLKTQFFQQTLRISPLVH